MIRTLTTALITTLFLASCEDTIVRTTKPSIELQEVGPETVVQYNDSIYMRIGFYDKDGDLGENFTDDRNLFVKAFLRIVEGNILDNKPEIH